VTAAEFLADARRVADAILYEGYLLYPYRGSARKNQSRFQFGVLMPPAYRDVDDCEPSASQTECLLECPEDAAVTVFARFLHLQRRQVEAKDGPGGFRAVASVRVDGAEVTTWDEAAEREHRATAPIHALLAGGVDAAFAVPGGESVEMLTDRRGRTVGQLVRRRASLAGMIRLRAGRLPGPYGGLRLGVTIEPDRLTAAGAGGQAAPALIAALTHARGRSVADRSPNGRRRRPGMHQHGDSAGPAGF
jgi:hypothetical protein